MPPDASGTACLAAPLAQLMQAHARAVSLPAGAQVFSCGTRPEHFVVVTDGTVRVRQISESGREIVLYRVGAGQTCSLTTVCLLGDEDYAAEAVAETDVRAWLLDRKTFDALLASTPAFRQFVFTSFGQRLTDLIRLVEEVVFTRLDVRLAHKLLDLADAQGRVTLTQEALAAELGTAREVVSRVLSEFRKNGLVSSYRGGLEITDRARLASYS